MVSLTTSGGGALRKFEFAVFEWTHERIDALSEMWLAGHSAGNIAKALGCTKNAVVGKSARIGLPRRPSPIVRTGAPPKRQRVDRPMLPVFRAPPPPPVPRRVIRDHGCCWVDGDRGNWLYCDGPIARGSYCAEHHARAYRPAQVDA